jgi:DNA replication protein DnaC
MNTTQTLEQLKQLRLQGMASFYGTQLELPVHQQLESHELMAQMAQAELLNQNQVRTTYYLKLARLRLPAMPEHIQCSESRNLTKQQLGLLLENQYIKSGESLLIVGPTGSGKSYLACALGYQACLHGYRALYMNMHKLIEKITLAKLDGSYLKLLSHFERTPLIILDDFGIQPLDQTVKVALLQIMEDRYARKAVIIASQLPVAKWHAYINEPTIADAILDRLTARCQRIELKGESMRKKSAMKTSA